jgi:hypothetical protein
MSETRVCRRPGGLSVAIAGCFIAAGSFAVFAQESGVLKVLPESAAAKAGVSEYRFIEKSDGAAVVWAESDQGTLATVRILPATDRTTVELDPAGRSSLRVTFGRRMDWVTLSDLGTRETGKAVFEAKAGAVKKDGVFAALEARLKREIDIAFGAYEAVTRRNTPKPEARGTCAEPESSEERGPNDEAFAAKDVEMLGLDNCRTSEPLCRGASYAEASRSWCCNEATQNANNCCTNMFCWGCCRRDDCDALCLVDDYVCVMCGVTGYRCGKNCFNDGDCPASWQCWGSFCEPAEGRP